MRGHCYDALVGLAGCDKSLARHDDGHGAPERASVFIYGGSILPGRHKGKDITVQDVFEAVGAHSAGKIDDEELHDIECAACPSAGSCGGQFTANTMACVSEAIGLALPGLGRRAGPLRVPRCLLRGLGRGGDEPARRGNSAARHRDPQVLGSTRHGWSRLGRLDQRRAASAGTGQRMRRRFRPGGCLQGVPRDALYRRPEAGRAATWPRISTRSAVSTSS